VRYAGVAGTAAKRALRADIVYATATYAAAAVASFLSRTPLAIKLVSDPAYERAIRYGLFDGALEDFQHPGAGRAELLKRLRTRALRRARAIVVPSAYLAEIAVAWGIDPRRVTVLPNPAPQVANVGKTTVEPGTFVFVGRLTRQKALEIAVGAVARVPSARLIVIGDGPERMRLEEVARSSGSESRITFLGTRPRDEALAIVAGADAALLTSAWENFPHAAVEALSVGVPVVSSAVGGVPEIVHDAENGLLVPPGSVDAVVTALTRMLEEPGLRERLAAAARPSVSHLSVEALYGRLEQVLAGVAGA
jgi:glycosyltransferase involved in cell wall biosynthesis